MVENAISDKPESLARVLGDVGYGTIVQDPKRITESPGFKQALNDLGLTDELITSALVNDIREKPKNRIQELKLGAEILGMVKREDPNDKPKTQNTYNFIFSAETQEKVKAINELIKSKLINENNPSS